MQRHAGIAMQRLDEGRAFRRNTASHRARQRLQHGDVAAACARGRGDLQADDAGADTQHAACVCQPRADQARVLKGAEVKRLVAAMDGQMPRGAANGEQQPIVVQSLAVGQANTVRFRFDSRHGGAQQQFDPLFRIALGRVKIRYRRFGFVGQDGLR